MLMFLPVGFTGLMVGGLIAANSSTILTHLNWGASYLVHDFYRRFITPTAPEKHYVLVGRISTVFLYVFAGILGLMLESAQGAFQVIISIGAGTGLLYLLRWFWWRISAWSEVVAMISSFAISVGFFLAGKAGYSLPFAQTIFISVGFTTACWLLAAYFGPQTDRATLIAFYKKVSPAGPGWAQIRREAGISEADAESQGDSMSMAALGWIAGSLTIWSSLFAIGNFLYGRTGLALALTAIFMASGATLLYVVNHVWDRADRFEA
jgi:hypothetical protein